MNDFWSTIETSIDYNWINVWWQQVNKQFNANEIALETHNKKRNPETPTIHVRKWAMQSMCVYMCEWIRNEYGVNEMKLDKIKLEKKSRDK